MGPKLMRYARYRYKLIAIPHKKIWFHFSFFRFSCNVRSGMDSNTESESGDDTSSSVESKLAHLEKSENLEQELRELFEYLDADRDSVLDKDEFERAFFELEMFVDTKELDRLFDKYSSKVYDDEIGVNFHSFKAVLRELTKRKERKKRSFLSARKLVKVLSRMGHVKNSIRDSIVRAISPIKKSRKKSKKSSMWDVTSIENDQLRLVVSLLSLFPPSYNHTHTHTTVRSHRWRQLW
jgi:Ca2+-binding EF-hand superfamily protein